MPAVPPRRCTRCCSDSSDLRTNRRNHAGFKTRTAVAAAAAAVILQSCLTSVKTASALTIATAAMRHPSGHGFTLPSWQSSTFSGRSAVGRSSERCWSAGAAMCPRRESRCWRGHRGGGLSMGIPKLFRWLTDQYPVISHRLDQGLNEVSIPPYVVVAKMCP